MTKEAPAEGIPLPIYEIKYSHTFDGVKQRYDEEQCFISRPFWSSDDPNLCSANAIKALLVAHTHRCSSLKEKCLPIIRENLKSLMGTEDWKQLEKNHDLTVMVLESFAG